ncbi:antitoxin VapB family protein [Natrialbaceae archaeon GCM10025810]|uniref:antitoxin VapB family protein n=1 Tax=Halovalidus salilacus TaxID=3075124 RepID=UPI00361AF830
MGTTTISLSDEAYERLKRRKRDGESFSDTVLRLTDRGDPLESAGAFDEFAEYDRREFRDEFERGFEARRRRLFETDEA